MSAAPRPHAPSHGRAAAPYYMSGATATMPDFNRKNALRLKKDHNRAIPTKKERKSFFQLPKLRTVILCGLLGLLVAGQYAAVQSMGHRINQIQSDYNKVKAANELLEQEYATLGDLNRVEKIAAKEFGMVHPEKVLAYRPTRGTDQKEQGDKGGDGA